VSTARVARQSKSQLIRPSSPLLGVPAASVTHVAGAIVESKHSKRAVLGHRRLRHSGAAGNHKPAGGDGRVGELGGAENIAPGGAACIQDQGFSYSNLLQLFAQPACLVPKAGPTCGLECGRLLQANSPLGRQGLHDGKKFATYRRRCTTVHAMSARGHLR